MSFNTGDPGNANSGDTANFATVFQAKVYETWRHQPVLAGMDTPVVHKKNMYQQGLTYQETQFADLPDPIKEYVGGNDILGQSFAFDNTTNTRDTGFILISQSIKREDMATAHYEMFQRIARAQTRKVKMEVDRRAFVTACLAARTAAKDHTDTGLNVHAGGNRVTQVAATVAAAFPRSAVGAANYRSKLRELALAMDEDAVPTENRWLWHTPHMNDVLGFDATGQVHSRDFIEFGVTGGDVMRREVKLVDGFKLVSERVVTTSSGGSMPNTNITTGPTRYQANFTVQASVGTPVALALCEGPDGDAAITMGEWEGIRPFFHYSEDKYAWIFGVSYLGGMSVMNPTCAGSIEVASS